MPLAFEAQCCGVRGRLGACPPLAHRPSSQARTTYGQVSAHCASCCQRLAHRPRYDWSGGSSPRPVDKPLTTPPNNRTDSAASQQRQRHHHAKLNLRLCKRIRSGSGKIVRRFFRIQFSGRRQALGEVTIDIGNKMPCTRHN